MLFHSPGDLIFFPFFQLLGLVLGTLYFGQEATQEGVQNINGGIFLILSSLTFSTANGVINVSFLRRISTSTLRSQNQDREMRECLLDK